MIISEIGIMFTQKISTGVINSFVCKIGKERLNNEKVNKTSIMIMKIICMYHCCLSLVW